MEQSDMLGDLVETADGSLTLRHPGHAETYHSSAGAETEARELYVQRSGITAAFDQGRKASVLDVGLGLAYNATATFDAWVSHPGPGSLSIYSLEHNHDLIRVLVDGRARWTAGWSASRLALISSLRQQESGWSAEYRHPTADAVLIWKILVGEAHDTLALCPGGFDFVWQDPFSPEKNPAMWSEAWFSMLRKHCGDDAVLMSYSVARIVRDALAASGWDCERIPTPVRQKKHWLRAKPRKT
jgi:tRNA U34 5-methylaminomethyl-2-thiouridine-forming methyltransferase MnmC